MLDYSKVNPFVYVVVCKDLSPAQIAVQGAHAVLEAGIHLEQCKDFPSGLVMLEVSSEKSLLKAQKKIEKSGIKTVIFWEEPMKRYTALATEAIPQDKRYLMKEFQLLKMKGK